MKCVARTLVFVQVSVFVVLDLAGKHFVGWKEISCHGPEEYLSLIFEGVEAEQTELKVNSSWLRHGRNKENNVLGCYILAHLTDQEISQAASEV